jgi:uncharacterized protein
MSDADGGGTDGRNADGTNADGTNADVPMVMAMFPLGHVAFPATAVPLRIFEPRYVQMIQDCLRAEEPEFGVVLIERGSEVGGGDARFDVGVAARILEVSPTSDGGYHVLAVAVRRIRVAVWLPDDPYPQALVHDLPDAVAADAGEVSATLVQLRRLLARCAEAEYPAPPATVELNEDDPIVLLWHLCAVAPVGPLDDYALLAAADGPQRLARLRDELSAVSAVVDSRLG